jgi:hypothetical protein
LREREVSGESGGERERAERVELQRIERVVSCERDEEIRLMKRWWWPCLLVGCEPHQLSLTGSSRFLVACFLKAGSCNIL